MCLTVQWKIAMSEMAVNSDLTRFGLNQRHFLLPISCVCSPARINPSKPLNYKVSLCKSLIELEYVQAQ